MGKFDSFVQRSSKWLFVIAGIAMTYVLVISVADIIMNKVFKDPINWAFDSISLIAVVASVCAISGVQSQHGHIEIEFLENRLPQSGKKVTSLFVNILGILLWGIVAWRSFIYGMDILKAGEVSMSVGMLIYPFIWLQGICAVAVVFVLLMQAINNLRMVTR